MKGIRGGRAAASEPSGKEMTMKKTVRAAIAFALVLTVALSMTGIVWGEPADAATKTVTGKKAVKIALKNAKTKKSKVCHLKKKYSKKDKCYHIEFYKKKNCVKYNYDVARYGGRIMERDVDYPYHKTCSREKIGKKKALRIVAKRSKKMMSVIKAGTCTYKYRNHEGIYQVKFRSGNYAWEYELVAPTGKIREIEYKYVGSRPGAVR